MMSRKSDLPFGSEFSPSQIDLAHVLELAELELAELHGGDRRAFENAVRAAYFEGHATSAYNRGKLANNTRLGMIAYGIIDRDANLTDFGHELSALKDDEPALYQRLAKHILLNLHGMPLSAAFRTWWPPGRPSLSPPCAMDWQRVGCTTRRAASIPA